MPPVYPSDRQSEEEEHSLQPHNGFSMLGILWLGGVYMAARELATAEVSPLGLALVGAGACLPLLVVRVRGSRDAVTLGVWLVAAGLYVAGLAVTAVTAPTHLAGAGKLLVRTLLTAQAAVSALVLACGAYTVARALGSVAAERKAMYVGSAVAVALTLAIVVTLHPGPDQDPRSHAPIFVPLVLWVLQAAVVGWTYTRLLAARPSLKRIARVFE